MLNACAIEFREDVDDEVAVHIWILLIPLVNSFASSIDVCLKQRIFHLIKIFVKKKHLTLSGDVCNCLKANNLAWSGCKSALDGRLCFLSPMEGFGDPIGVVLGEFLSGSATGDGDACIESIPESPPPPPACN